MVDPQAPQGPALAWSEVDRLGPDLERLSATLLAAVGLGSGTLGCFRGAEVGSRLLRSLRAGPGKLETARLQWAVLLSP